MRLSSPSRWTRPLLSQQVARRNAHQAMILLAQRRAEREAVEDYLAGLRREPDLPRQRAGRET